MTEDLILKKFELVDRCTHKSQCMPLSWCFWVCCLISLAWICSSGVTSAFRSGDAKCFAVELFSILNLIVSLSAQFRDEARYTRSCVFIDFSYCLRSASDSSLGVIYFSSLSTQVRAFLRLDVVKLFLHRAAHTETRTFIIVAVTGHGNIQYFTMKCSTDELPSFTLESMDRTSSLTA